MFYSERFRKANGSNSFRFIKDMFQTELNRVKNTCLIEKTKRLYEYHLVLENVSTRPKLF